MVKRVTTKSGREFRPMNAAKIYFNGLRDELSVGGRLDDPDRSDILDIYQRYCTATKYPAVDAVDVTTEIDNRQRSQGRYAQTKAFAVVDAKGKTHIFSIDEALTRIAE